MAPARIGVARGQHTGATECHIQKLGFTPAGRQAQQTCPTRILLAQAESRTLQPSPGVERWWGDGGPGRDAGNWERSGQTGRHRAEGLRGRECNGGRGK